MNADIVVPTTRPERLGRLLARLRGFPGDVIVVDGTGRSPAAARNLGWRRADGDGVVFLDDDVEPEADWERVLSSDLAAAKSVGAGGSQGRVVVPLPRDRRPTDWERCVAGLRDARWATADMAYRRAVLAELGGFDERFTRPYREDSDLALRVRRAGHPLLRGERRVVHPVGKASPWVSLRRQAGNRDDALMHAKHGSGWRREAGAPGGRLRRHALVTAAGAVAVAAAGAGNRRVARLAGLAWLAGTVELCVARIAPGPRTAREISTMVATSLALPPHAVWSYAAGRRAHRRVRAARRTVDAVLFDRDGTLVVDVPYNRDPERVTPMPGARAAVARCRAAGLRVGVVTNQSGIARGLLTSEQVGRVNAAVDRAVGPFDAWVVCPHAPDAECGCRKPAPGGVRAAAAALGVDPRRCVVVGDIGSDVEAGRAAQARSVLVPTARTRRAEIDAAPAVAASLTRAVDVILGERA